MLTIMTKMFKPFGAEKAEIRRSKCRLIEGLIKKRKQFQSLKNMSNKWRTINNSRKKNEKRVVTILFFLSVSMTRAWSTYCFT